MSNTSDNESYILDLIKSHVKEHAAVSMTTGAIVLDTGFLSCKRKKINLMQMTGDDLPALLFNHGRQDGIIPIRPFDYAFVETMHYFGQHITQCCLKNDHGFTCSVVPKFIIVQKSTTNPFFLPHVENQTHCMILNLPGNSVGGGVSFPMSDYLFSGNRNEISFVLFSNTITFTIHPITSGIRISILFSINTKHATVINVVPSIGYDKNLYIIGCLMNVKKKNVLFTINDPRLMLDFTKYEIPSEFVVLKKSPENIQLTLNKYKKFPMFWFGGMYMIQDLIDTNTDETARTHWPYLLINPSREF